MAQCTITVVHVLTASNSDCIKQWLWILVRENCMPWLIGSISRSHYILWREFILLLVTQWGHCCQQQQMATSFIRTCHVHTFTISPCNVLYFGKRHIYSVSIIVHWNLFDCSICIYEILFFQNYFTIIKTILLGLKFNYK